MKNKKGKILSMLLVLTMIISMFPLSVFAKDIESKKILAMGNQAENKYLAYMAKKQFC